MIGLDFLLLGYFTVGASGRDITALTDLLLKHSIPAKNIQHGRFAIRKKYREKLFSVASGLHLEASENKGLPNFIYRNGKRYGVFAALLLMSAFSFYASERVWDVRVVCDEKSDVDEVLSALSDEGLRTGASFRKMDFSSIENSVLKSCPDVAWISLYRQGTVVYANLISRRSGRAPSSQVVGNLIAGEECVIISVSPNSGEALVKAGDTVKKGDLLISAVQKDGTLSGAEGAVFGRVNGEATASCARREIKKTSKKEKTVRMQLNFLDFSINIFKNYGNLKKGYDIIKSERKLRLFGRISFPLSVTVYEAYSYETEEIFYTEAEMIKKCSTRLRMALSEITPLGDMSGMRTVSEWTEEGYKMTVYYEQIRNIALWERIEIAEEK